MTRKQEEKIETQHYVAKWARRKRGPVHYPVFSRRVRQDMPLDRIGFEQRLAYGFELLDLEGE